MRNNTLALASLSASVCLSVCLSIYLCVCASLSLYLSLSLARCLSHALALSRSSLMFLSHAPTTSLSRSSLSASICLRLSVYLSVCPSVHARALNSPASPSLITYEACHKQRLVANQKTIKRAQGKYLNRVACRAAYASISLGADPSEP